MKRTASLLSILILGIFISPQISAQCIPDPDCTDTGNPGEFCPLSLPDAGLNIPYDEVVTIIPPGVFYYQQAEVPILYIEIDSVKNLPPGMDYSANTDRFYPDTAYCIELAGTPTQTGEFTLSIYILATVEILGTPLSVPVMDDSSVVITVVDNLGTRPEEFKGFQVFPNVPNPFFEQTRLSYYSPVEDLIELTVYNILGVQVYHESDEAAPGEHNFRFDGRELQPGTYLYRIQAGDAYFTGKLMKSR